MPRCASVKGSVFSGVIEDVRKLLASGDVSRGEAARRLEPGAPEALTASTCRLLGDGPARRVEQHGDDDCQAEHAVHPAIVTMPIQGSDPPPVR